MEPERRVVDVTELRVSGDDKKRVIVGHAAVFNSATDLKSFRETIMPGAFSESIVNDDIRALINHDKNLILGRTKSGTLRLKEDMRGLYFEIDTPDTQIARDFLVSLERRDIDQMSFSFKKIKDSWKRSNDGNGLNIRTLEQVQIFDISPVTFPAYENTDVALREHEAWQKTLKEPEPTWNRIPNMRRKLKLQSWR